MSWLSQVLLVTSVNLRTIPQRLGWSSSAAVGVAFVVAVLVTVLAMAEGFGRTLREVGSPGTAIVLRGGATSESDSYLLREDTRIIRDAPGIARSGNGQDPIASGELFVIVDIPKKSSGTDANVPMRGVEPPAFEIRENVRIVEGRNFRPGQNEFIAGVAAADSFAGLDVGNTFRWGGTDWTLVGLFAADGAVYESELWCDIRVLQPTFRRGNTFQSVYAKLESPQAFDAFKDALTTDPRLNAKVMRETDYFVQQSELIHGLIMGLGLFVAGVMALGAIFGALNTMYAAVSARTREIATLRALGFRAGPVVASVLAESLVLALLGGLAGGLLAYVGANGYRAATMNWATFSQVAFTLVVTPETLMAGLFLALLLGLVGGILPAVRAARLPVTAALREL